MNKVTTFKAWGGAWVRPKSGLTSFFATPQICLIFCMWPLFERTFNNTKAFLGAKLGTAGTAQYWFVRKSATPPIRLIFGTEALFDVTFIVTKAFLGAKLGTAGRTRNLRHLRFDSFLVYKLYLIVLSILQKHFLGQSSVRPVRPAVPEICDTSDLTHFRYRSSI